MKIGVSGASGNLGQDHKIVAISRTPDRAPSGTDSRFGDHDIPESLEQAYAGLDRLLLIPSSNLRRGIRNATGNRAYSGAERAALVTEITGKPIGFTEVPEQGLRGGMAQAGLPEEVINAAISIQSDFARGAFDIVTGDLKRLSGRKPAPLRDILAGALQSLPESG